MKEGFTLESIQAIISDPVYIGIGGFEQVISDKIWIKVAIIAIQKDGVRQFLENVLCNLERNFAVELKGKKEWVQDVESTLKRYDPNKALQDLLLFLRDFFKNSKSDISDFRKSYIKWRINSPMGLFDRRESHFRF
jgi:hypothetical protein